MNEKIDEQIDRLQNRDKKGVEIDGRYVILLTRAFREFIIPLKKAPLLPLYLYLFLFLFLFLHSFTSLSLEKKGIMPGLIAACNELKCNARSSLQFLTPSPLNTLRLFTIPFLPFHTLYFHLAGIFGGNFDSERTPNVPCKCRHKRNEASYLTPCD